MYWFWVIYLWKAEVCSPAMSQKNISSQICTERANKWEPVCANLSEFITCLKETVIVGAFAAVIGISFIQASLCIFFYSCRICFAVCLFFRSIWFSCDEWEAASRASFLSCRIKTSFYSLTLLYDPCANKLNIFYVRNDLKRFETIDYSPPSVNLKQTFGSISYGFPTETGKKQSKPKGVWGGEQPDTHWRTILSQRS